MIEWQIVFSSLSATASVCIYKTKKILNYWTIRLVAKAFCFFGVFFYNALYILKINLLDLVVSFSVPQKHWSQIRVEALQQI